MLQHSPFDEPLEVCGKLKLAHHSGHWAAHPLWIMKYRDTCYILWPTPLFTLNFTCSGSSVVSCSDVTMTSPAFVETLQGLMCEEGGSALFKAYVTGSL